MEMSTSTVILLILFVEVITEYNAELGEPKLCH